MTEQTKLKPCHCDMIFYLASPYTHADPAVMQSRYHAAVRAVMELQEIGYTAFSPIVHSVPVEMINGNNDLDYWLEIDKKYIRKFDGLIILLVEGWQHSRGVMREIEYAREIGKLVYAYDELSGQVARIDSDASPALQYGGG